MNQSIYDHRDYKAYLRAWIESRPDGGRGIKSEMAAAVNCQKAYVSQVLSGSAHFSLEQADSLNVYLGHSPEEAHFFFLLIQYARAGKPTLRTYFEGEINKVIEQRLVIKNRLQVKDTLTPEAQATYYSAWYYAAIHMMLGLERFQSKEAVMKALGLSAKVTNEVFEFLVSFGLAKQTSLGRFEIGPTRLHLDRNSPLISKHHTNWRMQGIRSLERAPDQDLHYSVVISISDEDVTKLKAMIVSSIQDVMKVAHASKDESIHCLAIDFFGV